MDPLKAQKALMQHRSSTDEHYRRLQHWLQPLGPTWLVHLLIIRKGLTESDQNVYKQIVKLKDISRPPHDTLQQMKWLLKTIAALKAIVFNNWNKISTATLLQLGNRYYSKIINTFCDKKKKTRANTWIRWKHRKR